LPFFVLPISGARLPSLFLDKDGAISASNRLQGTPISISAKNVSHRSPSSWTHGQLRQTLSVWASVKLLDRLIQAYQIMPQTRGVSEVP